ncbi:MAG: thioesterase domain-containing protein [Candidatus Korobacteraceae bacterium]
MSESLLVPVSGPSEGQRGPVCGDLVHGRHRLIPIQPNGSRPPLFWIPGGFGSVNMSKLRELANRLGPDQPMYGLGTPPALSTADIEPASERAAAYVALIRQLQPSGPYFLVGFCLGGTLAFEAAQQLRAQNQQVAFLGLLNAWVPIYRISAWQWSRILLQRGRYQLRGAMASGTRIGLRYAMGRFGAVRKLATRARELGQTPTGSECDGSAGRLLWATIRIWGRYVPQPFPGKVHLFLSNEADLAGVSRRVDPRRGWARVCSDHEVIELKGEHVQMLEPPLLDNFAALLAKSLDEAQLQAAA